MTGDSVGGGFKLGRHQPGVGVVEHRYGDVFERRFVQGREALVLGPSSGQIELVKRLVRELVVPFRIVYVLLVPFGSYAEGRYELAETFDHDALELFLDRYRQFFEGDARHHLLIGTADEMPLLVYDQHNLIYAFGSVARAEEIAAARGLKAGSPEMPIPHSHHTRVELDSLGESLLRKFRYSVRPLLATD